MTDALSCTPRQPYGFFLETPKNQRYFKRYCRYLEMDSVDDLEDLESLKVYAKSQFRLVIRKFHPDTSQRTSSVGAHRRTGQSYQRILAAYQWLMRLKESDFVQAEKPYTLPTEVATPWHWDQSPDMPLGYQEDMSRYWY